MLGCSKQTVLRLIDDIRRSYGVEIEETVRERNKFYRLRRPGSVPPALALTGGEMSVLFMCQAFARHLLGETMFEEAATAIEKNRAIAAAGGGGIERHVTSFRPGSIDYTPHEKVIRTLLRAMETGTVCEVVYRSLPSSRAKRFLVMPLKIFSHNDTIYLSARYAGKPGGPPAAREYDPLLAVHRVREVTMTDRSFVYPRDYNFEEIYNRNFGIIKGDPQGGGRVHRALGTLRGRGVWSPDQRVVRVTGGPPGCRSPPRRKRSSCPGSCPSGPRQGLSGLSAWSCDEGRTGGHAGSLCRSRRLLAGTGRMCPCYRGPRKPLRRSTTAPGRSRGGSGRTPG
jgi:hypothetical protein